MAYPKSTLATWCKKAKTGDPDTGSGTRTLAEAMNIARQLQEAKKHIKELEKEKRLEFISLKTDDGKLKGKIVTYCEYLHVSTQAFYDYLRRKNSHGKYDGVIHMIQSMNSAGERCHDNARCESMWSRMKNELFYDSNDKPENYTREQLKVKIWRYFMSYWKNRRICTANGGLPPAVKRNRYFATISRKFKVS